MATVVTIADTLLPALGDSCRMIVPIAVTSSYVCAVALTLAWLVSAFL